MTWEYYNIETTNLCLNIIFISIFTILVKSVIHEISLKINQKAAKILLVPPDPLHLHQHRVLVTSLVQVLVVWVLVTLLQLAGLRPYPGQDLLLASIGLAAAKLALVTSTRAPASENYFICDKPRPTARCIQSEQKVWGIYFYISIFHIYPTTNYCLNHASHRINISK